MDNQHLVELTADIVAAHVANNAVDVGEIAGLVERVHLALSGLGQVAEEPQAKVPAVSVRASVKADRLICLECGAVQKTLKRHLQVAHGLTPAEYRKDYGLPAGYPMTAPEYSERRAAMAKSIGLGRKKDGTPSRKGSGRGRKPKGSATNTRQVKSQG